MPCVAMRRPCLITDDQFAVVPRAWAAEFYAHCSTGALGALDPTSAPIGTDAAAVRELTPQPPHLPHAGLTHPGLTPEALQALEAKVTAKPNWTAVMHTSPKAPPPEAIYRRWGDALQCAACMACNSSSKMQNMRCAEPRLTARLLALRVPLAVSRSMRLSIT